MKWDWIIFPHATLTEQLILDFVAPALIVLFFRTPRFYDREAVGDDPSAPAWERNLWKYLLGVLYLWFFSATIWHFCQSPAR